MTKRKIIFLLLIFLSVKLTAQSISGYVYTGDNSPLYGATVIIKELSRGTITSQKGYFEFTGIPAGKYNLEVSYVGYKKQVSSVTFPNSGIPLTITLSEESITTDQVIVTASKHEESISELPVSAIAILPLSIEKKNRIALDEVLRYVPGIHMSLDQISIRGSSGYSKGAGTRVLTAIDGVPIYTGDTGEIIWEMIPITNIERIEIIKGPASSLYGSTAIGGVINVISKKIYEKPITQLSTYAGFYSDPYHSEWKWSGRTRTFYGLGINHSNTAGNIGYSISLKKMGNDSYRENDYSKRILGFAKIDISIDSVNSLSFFGSYLNMNRGNFLYWKDGANALVPKDEDNGKIVKSDRWFGSIIYTHKFNNKFSSEIKSSIYSTKFEGIGLEVTSSQSNLIRNELLAHLQLSSSFFMTTGGEMSYSAISSDIFHNKNFKTLSAYSQIEFKGIERLIASLGVRYDYIKLDSLSGAGAVSPKIGFNYKLNENIILRSSLGTGFRAPTPAEVFTSIGVGSIPIKENPNLTFEKSFSFDAGLLFNPDPDCSFDFSLFYNEYDNFIEPVLLKSGFIQFINLPKAKTEGFEIINENRLFNGFVKTNIGYTYLWSRDVENNLPMKYRPRNTVYAGISFLPLPFEVSLDFRFMSKVERIDDDLTRPPLELVPDGDKRSDVYVVDLCAGYNFTLYQIPVRAYFNCKNLFNYNYVEFIGNVAPIRNYSISLDLFF